MIFFKKQVILATFLLVLGSANLSANVSQWPEEINFGVIPRAGATSMIETYGSLTKHLESELGIKVNLKTTSDYAGVISAMKFNHVQIAYLGPKSYVEAARRSKAEALVVEIDAETGIPGYYGIIISKKGSNIKTLEDLKGKKWAFTSSHSTSGTLVPSVMFMKKDIKPKKYFSKILYSGGHEASILSVKAGKIDAASTNNLDFQRGLGKQWNKDDFNIIWKSDIIPGSVMTARSDLPESLKKAVKDAFISYDDEVQLAKMKLKGFTSVTDSDYDSVRELMKLKKSMKKKK
jgi:phosphonate transport system substrate-binding protein